MAIRQLSLTDFRNLESTTLDFHPSLNLVYGNNGSGKTSLLEAIHVLCQARSFRQHQLKKCIQHGKSNFLLFGRFTEYKAGLSKSDRKLDIRVNGETIKRRSSLVSKTPINIVDSQSFGLITGPPEQRRQYIDWCMFHVEQSYTEHWTQFRQALRQRNKLLKTGRNYNLLDYWDEYLIRPSLVLQDMRIRYCREISHTLNHELSDLVSDINISLIYRQGWASGLSLQESLKKTREKDIRRGFTNSGIHRDDLEILSDSMPANDILSRGQLKRLSMALLIAALKIVSRQKKRPIILLIDDLQAEMDDSAQAIVYKALFDIDVQLFVTNIDETLSSGLEGKEYKMFHVEHGMIRTRKIY